MYHRKMEKLTYPTFGRADMKCNPMDLAQMQVDTINAMEGTLTDYDCPKCHNKGYIMYLREDGTRCCSDCTCKPIRESVRNMKRSGLETVIAEKTFDAFRAETPWQKWMKQTAMDYAEKPEGWLLMSGQSGCGKTHLCTAVCRELLLRRMQVCYISWREEARFLGDFRADAAERGKRMQKLKDSPVLYVDDLFKLPGGGKLGSVELSLAFELFNHRYHNHLPTIISTELTRQALIGLDDGLGSRIVEMAGAHTCQIREDRSRNYRVRELVQT